VLVDLAAHHGLNLDALREYLESDRDTDTVYEENARAHRLGINGVPAFNFNGGMVISGAQEPEVLIRVMDAASAANDALEAYS
jgi:predicted DsbA family dithiol-disulfide isomerase